MRRLTVLIGVLLLCGVGRAEAQHVTVTHAAINVTSSSALALAKNEQRTYLVLENISDTDISCAFDTTAVANTGIVLKANGGALVQDAKTVFGNLYCIHGSSGSKTLLVTEGIQ